MAEQWSSQPDAEPPCDECDDGWLKVVKDGEFIGQAICPFREDAAKCMLARANGEQAGAQKTAWLRGHGVLARYHHMSIDHVAEKARLEVAGYTANLADEVTEGRGLLIGGAVGTGKTAILGLIADAAYDAGINETEFVYSFDLYAAFFRHNPERDDERMRRWRQARLLLLDELGAAYTTDFSLSEFEGFVEHRHAACLATCVTTNVPLDKLKKVVSARVYDRWRSTCTAIELAGGSKRTALTPQGGPQ